MSIHSSQPIACSFCGKPQQMVAKLVVGPGVHICDECITENLEDGTLLLFRSGDYIDGDKHIEKSKKAYRRRKNLDGLVGEE